MNMQMLDSDYMIFVFQLILWDKLVVASLSSLVSFAQDVSIFVRKTGNIMQNNFLMFEFVIFSSIKFRG